MHLNRLAAGRIAYLASLDCAELLPVAVTPVEKGPAIVTQPQSKRWIVHLIGDGDYTLHLDRVSVPATKVVDRYPKSGWDVRETATASGLLIEVRGGARDRLLVLQ